MKIYDCLGSLAHVDWPTTDKPQSQVVIDNIRYTAFFNVCVLGQFDKSWMRGSRITLDVAVFKEKTLFCLISIRTQEKFEHRKRDKERYLSFGVPVCVLDRAVSLEFIADRVNTHNFLKNW